MIRNHCLLLENTLKQLSGENFPVIVGRRPLNQPTTNKENQCPTMVRFFNSKLSHYTGFSLQSHSFVNKIDPFANQIRPFPN